MAQTKLKQEQLNIALTPSWTNVSYLNSWVTVSGGAPLRYWKDALGWVHVEGLIKSGTINTAAGNLPAGYRPSVQATGNAAATNTGYGVQYISSGGDIVPSSGGTTWFSINIVFYPS